MLLGVLCIYVIIEIGSFFLWERRISWPLKGNSPIFLALESCQYYDFQQCKNEHIINLFPVVVWCKLHRVCTPFHLWLREYLAFYVISIDSHGVKKWLLLHTLQPCPSPQAKYYAWSFLHLVYNSYISCLLSMFGHVPISPVHYSGCLLSMCGHVPRLPISLVLQSHFFSIHSVQFCIILCPCWNYIVLTCALGIPYTVRRCKSHASCTCELHDTCLTTCTECPCAHLSTVDKPAPLSHLSPYIMLVLISYVG